MEYNIENDSLMDIMDTGEEPTITKRCMERLPIVRAIVDWLIGLKRIKLKTNEKFKEKYKKGTDFKEKKDRDEATVVVTAATVTYKDTKIKRK